MSNPWSGFSERARKIVPIFITARLVACVAAAVSFAAFPAQKTVGQLGYVFEPHSKLFELLFGVWERADAIWYMGIAKSGYHVDLSAFAFFPLYPLLIKLLDFVQPFSSLLNALLISHIACFFGLYFVYELARTELDEAQAERATWLLAFFPGSLFFFAPYTESLFLALSAGALLSARKDRWIVAAAFGFFLALTRNLGVLIGVPLALELGIRSGWSVSRAWKKKGATLLLIPCAVLLWMFYCDQTESDALIFVHRQSSWQRHSDLPWNTLWDGVRLAWLYCASYTGSVYVLEAVSMLLAVVMGSVAIFRKSISWPLVAWLWIGLLPGLFAPFDGNPLLSCYRFVAVLFPVFMVLSTLVKSGVYDQALRYVFCVFYTLAIGMLVCNQNVF